LNYNNLQLLTNSSLGFQCVLAGNEVAANRYGSPYLDPGVPDLVIGTKPNVLWNVGFGYMDHSGVLPQDLNVPLLAYNPMLLPLNITQVVSNRLLRRVLHRLGAIVP